MSEEMYIRVKRKIEKKIADEPAINESMIDVDVDGGKAVLEGSVGSYWEKSLAEGLANVREVRNVENRIEVILSKRRDDSNILEEIKGLLEGKDEIEDVKVEVSDGEVKLEGKVGDWQDYDYIEEVSEKVEGVKDLSNMIRVEQTSPEDTTG